jgi:hypothetical protein
MSRLKGIRDEVSVSVAAEFRGDLGKIERVRFVCRYRNYRVTEANALLERVRSGALGDEELVRTVLIDWRDLKGDDGSAIEFNDESLAEALEHLPYRRAIVNGWMEQQFGIKA